MAMAADTSCRSIRRPVSVWPAIYLRRGHFAFHTSAERNSIQFVSTNPQSLSQLASMAVHHARYTILRFRCILFVVIRIFIVVIRMRGGIRPVEYHAQYFRLPLVQQFERFADLT